MNSQPEYSFLQTEFLLVWGGGRVEGVGMIIGDAMIPFSRSRFEIPISEIPVFEIPFFEISVFDIPVFEIPVFEINTRTM